MLSSTLLLLASALATASAQDTPTSTSSINRTPEGTPIPLEDTIDAICQPTFYIWDRGTLDQKRAAGLDQYDREEMELSLENSPFPCERAMYLQSFCLPSINIQRNSMDEPYDAEDEVGKGSKEQIIKERECYCNSEAWDLMTGCTNCQAIHGYGQESPYINKTRLQQEWVKQKFCNETIPGRNFYHLVNSNENYELFGGGGDGYETGHQGKEDETGGETEVSWYWTASASRTAEGTESGARASTTAESTADGEVTEIRGTVTSTSSGGSAAATETGGSAVSSAASAASSAPAAAAAGNEVNVGGGLVMVVLGAMALL